MQEPQITFQPVVPVRATASDASEMVTQLLFGEEVLVLERDRQWLRIRAMADGYEGWIDEKAVLAAPKAWLDQVPGWTLVETDHAMAFKEYQCNTLPLRLPIAARWPQAQDGTPMSSFTLGEWTFRLPSDQSSNMGRTPPPPTLRLSKRQKQKKGKKPHYPLSTIHCQLKVDPS
ncbi:MAG: SH3 domain-containing protein [Bacteroidia bacterium]